MGNEDSSREENNLDSGVHSGQATTTGAQTPGASQRRQQTTALRDTRLAPQVVCYAKITLSMFSKSDVILQTVKAFMTPVKQVPGQWNVSVWEEFDALAKLGRLI